MEDQNRAWDVIQKRQDYLDNLEAQAAKTRSELKRIKGDIKTFTEKRDKYVADMIKDAHEVLVLTKSHLMRQKYNLKFEIAELEKKHQRLTNNIEFAWAEHNDLVKVTSNLNQEVSVMMMEVKATTTQGKVILRDIGTQITQKKAARDILDNELATQRKALKDLQANITQQRGIWQKEELEQERKKQRYIEQITQNKLQLESTYKDLYKAIDQLKDISSTDKAMREAIADERIKLEGERIKVRKNKVNSNLLEL